MIRKASYGRPSSIACRYAGISWWIGQDVVQGARKQFISGRLSSTFIDGSGFTGLL